MIKNFHFIVVFLLLLLVPFIQSEKLFNGIISAKQLWFYVCASMIFIVSAINVLLLGQKKQISQNPSSIMLNSTDLLLAVFYLFILIRTLTTPYIAISLNLKFINWSLLIIIYYIIRFLIFTNTICSKTNGISNYSRINTQFIRIIILIVIMTGLLEAGVGLLQLYGIIHSPNSNFKITGTFYNPAPYSLYLAMTFPLALGMYLNSKFPTREKNIKTQIILPKIRTLISESFVKHLSLITIIAIILIIPSTSIRASWLGILTGSILVLSNNKLFKKLELIGTSSRRSYFYLCVIFTMLSIGLYFLKKDSSNSKLLIWEITLNKIAEKPIFGHGIGRFEADYNNWQADFFANHSKEVSFSKGMLAGNTKYCFNEYLEMASEIGITGLLLFLSIFLSVSSIRQTRSFLGSSEYKGSESEKKILPNKKKWYLYLRLFSPGICNAPSHNKWHYIKLIVSSSYITLLFCAVFSIPFYSLPTHIMIFILLAIISSYKASIVLFRVPPTYMLAFKAFIVIFLFCHSLFLLNLTKKQYISYSKMNEAIKLYQSGAYYEACQSFSDIPKVMRNNGTYLQYYAKSLFMCKAYKESINMYLKAKEFTSDEILYCSLGDSYKAIKLYDKAESAYIHATFMVPFKLYSLYLLAEFYDTTGQGEKAVCIAKETLSKNIKVESEATKEIVGAMKSIIIKYQGNQ